MVARGDRSRRGSGVPPTRPATGLTRDPRLAASDEAPDAEEVSRLRAEVERLRNELFVARQEAVAARRRDRVEFCRQLVQTLGHELRTSVTLVLGWTELLIDGKLPSEKRVAAYETIYAAGWRVESALRWLERVVEHQPPDSWPRPDLEHAAGLTSEQQIDGPRPGTRG